MALASGGWRFKDRVFTAQEQERADAARSPGPVYARRWAAKEACLKAMARGQGMGIAWKDIELLNTDDGQPYLVLHRTAAERLAEMTPQGMRASTHVSLSDEPPFCQAFVVIDAVRN